MGLDVYSRREYRQGKFVYLLDDDVSDKQDQFWNLITETEWGRT